MTTRFSLIAAAALAACTVESTPPPLAAGTGLTIDETSGTISLDATRVPLAVADCEPGTLVVRTATGWACVTPASVGSEAARVAETCTAGQVVERTSQGFACATRLDATRTPVLTACEEGTFVRRTATGWSCEAALEPASTPIVANCQPGQFVRRGNAGWECAAVSTGGGDGTYTGTFVGDLTGDVHGDVTGDLRGDVTGDLVGNVMGNVTGNVTGDLKGRVTGNVLGDLTGNVRGDLIGRVTGNVTGDLTGNVTGNVSGTATGLLGVLPLANGGTGTGTLAANTLPLVSSAGGALVGLAPPAQPALFGSDGTRWTTLTPATLGLATRTQGPLTIWVRVDGSDTACNGSADAPASAAPACAKANLPAALEAIPDVVRDDVTVRLAAGTYYLQSIYVLRRDVGSTSSLIIKGVPGETFIDGSRPTTPGVATTNFGLRIINTDVTLEGLSFRWFKTNALQAQLHSTLILNDTSSYGSGINLSCDRHAYCSLNTLGTIPYLDFRGTGGTGTGISVASHASIAIFGPADVSGNAVGLSVVEARYTSTTPATLTANDTTSSAINVSQLANVQLSGKVVAQNCARECLVSADNAVLAVAGGATFSSATRTFLVSTGGVLRLANTKDLALEFDCTGTTGRLGTASNRGLLMLQGDPAGAIRSSGTCQKGIEVVDGSYMGNVGPARTLTLTGAGEKPVTAGVAAVVQRGPFASTDVTCTGAGAQCY